MCLTCHVLYATRFWQQHATSIFRTSAQLVQILLWRTCETQIISLITMMQVSVDAISSVPFSDRVLSFCRSNTSGFTFTSCTAFLVTVSTAGHNALRLFLFSLFAFSRGCSLTFHSNPCIKELFTFTVCLDVWHPGLINAFQVSLVNSRSYRIPDRCTCMYLLWAPLVPSLLFHSSLYMHVCTLLNVFVGGLKLKLHALY